MKVYKLEECGRSYIGHWFTMMLASLKDVDLSEKIQLCFDLDYTNEPYQKESLDILSDVIEVVPKTSNAIFLPGNKIQTGSQEEYQSYIFLRELFLSRMQNDFDTSEYDKIYIRRNKSHLCEGNIFAKSERKRQIVNEDELVEKLSENGIRALNFEYYSVSQKIQIFNNASLVIAPNGGGLVFSLFAGLQTKIVELNPQQSRSDNSHYEFISKGLKTDFIAYRICQNIDAKDNMKIDVEDFIDYLETI